MTQSPLLVYIRLLLTALFWGGTFIAGKLIAKRVDPFSAAFLRFSVASFLLLILASRERGGFPPIKRTQFIALLLLGMTGVFSYNAFFFKGLQYINAGRAALIVANNPIFITLFAALIFRERLSWIKVLGIVLSVCGAMVVISKGSLGELLRGGVGPGEILVFGCVGSWVAYTLIGTAALFIPALAEGMVTAIPRYGVLDWVCIAYLGVFGTVLGFVWYYEGIKALGPTRAGQFINFVPIFAILLAFFILDEDVTLSLLVGAALVISGVSLTNVKS